MKSSIESVNISRNEVEIALKSFLERGNSIKVLPAQKEFSKNWVGGKQWAAYEDFDELDYIFH